ncbi:hypothetical protein TWF481_002643 [Arthrobotrys musiformis]|uniref:Uncharacterized protein n=1 Tax=Arthrobotrys musiformis TaxID=47236 RepID=A0AAV9VX03_9PEZI
MQNPISTDRSITPEIRSTAVARLNYDRALQRSDAAFQFSSPASVRVPFAITGGAFDSANDLITKINTNKMSSVDWDRLCASGKDGFTLATNAMRLVTAAAGSDIAAAACILTEIRARGLLECHVSISPEPGKTIISRNRLETTWFQDIGRWHGFGIDFQQIISRASSRTAAIRLPGLKTALCGKFGYQLEGLIDRGFQRYDFVRKDCPTADCCSDEQFYDHMVGYNLLHAICKCLLDLEPLQVEQAAILMNGRRNAQGRLTLGIWTSSLRLFHNKFKSNITELPSASQPALLTAPPAAIVESSIEVSTNELNPADSVLDLTSLADEDTPSKTVKDHKAFLTSSLLSRISTSLLSGEADVSAQRA